MWLCGFSLLPLKPGACSPPEGLRECKGGSLHILSDTKYLETNCGHQALGLLPPFGLKFHLSVRNASVLNADDDSRAVSDLIDGASDGFSLL